MRHCGSSMNIEDFIVTMKADHTFAIEYCAELLRFSYQWDGPIKRGLINPWLSRASMLELEQLIAA